MRLSARTRWERTENPLSRALHERRARGGEILDLTVSNPTRVGIAYPEQTILRALASPEALRYEPSPFGAPFARQAVSDYYRDRGVPVPPDRIAMVASTSEAYSYLFRLLCDPGDEVLVPAPSYPLLELLAQIDDVVVRTYPLCYAGEWSVDLARLREAVTPRTRAILAVSPNNPTGSFLRPEEVRALVATAASAGAALVVDEVFADYALPGAEVVPFVPPSDTALVFCLNGLSKACGLPQLKIGWIRASGPPDLVAEALARLEIVADTFLSVNAPAQCALPTLLVDGMAVQRAIRARTAENLANLRAAIPAGAAFGPLHVEGGWVSVLRLPRTRSDEDWALHLLCDHGVLVQPGFFYDFDSEGHAVVSLLTPPDVLAEGMARVAAAVAAEVSE